MSNQTGFFDDSKREYVIENMFPKRPWKNFLWNDRYFMSIDQFGFGVPKMQDETGSLWAILQNTDNRLIFIKDEETGEYYAANRNYDNKDFDVFETHVGQGYSDIVSEYKGIHTDFKIIVPTKGSCECWEVTVENRSDKDMKLSLYGYADMCAEFSEHAAYSDIDYSENLNGILFEHIGFRMPTKMTSAFFGASRKADYYETAMPRFKGCYSDIAHPIALDEENLSSQGYSFENIVSAALQFKLELKPGECEKIVFVLGAGKSVEELKEYSDAYAGAENFEKELEKIKAGVEEYQNKIIIDTPDEEINRRINIWLKRQIDFGKQWGRGYGKGFRDTMQDIKSFLPLDPKLARTRLIYVVSHQRINGNPIRQWDPFLGVVYTDGAVWMMYTLNAYLRETNDFSILNEKTTYYDSDKEETILEHALRGMNYLQENLGKHGLCLWYGGDWNDSIDGCGDLGIGESVWLSEATVLAADKLSEILERIGDNEDAEKFRKRAAVMAENVLKHGWDKDHFIYGINDYGEKIGAYEAEEGKIFLNPQTWAILSGIVKGEDAVKLMGVVEDKLGCDYGYLQQYPSYTHGSDKIGRISYFGAGQYENGSVYNHGVAFKVVADSTIGNNDAALETIHRILPCNPKNPAEKSGVEPYAMSNMYLGPECETRGGDAPISWITGTCGWLFSGVLEGMIGVSAGFDGLEIRPNLPTSWDKVNIIRTFRGCTYDIDIIGVRLNDGLDITVDGNKIDGNVLPLFDDGKTHKVTVKAK